MLSYKTYYHTATTENTAVHSRIFFSRVNIPKAPRVTFATPTRRMLGQLILPHPVSLQAPQIWFDFCSRRFRDRNGRHSAGTNSFDRYSKRLEASNLLVKFLL